MEDLFRLVDFNIPLLLLPFVGIPGRSVPATEIRTWLVHPGSQVDAIGQLTPDKSVNISIRTRSLRVEKEIGGDFLDVRIVVDFCLARKTQALPSANLQ